MTARSVAWMSGPELPSLTGVRGAAAFAVFVSHTPAYLPNPHIDVPGHRSLEVRDVLSWGSHGVGLFFVLSGLILTWTADGHLAMGRFWLRRCARVWPTHAVVWGLFLALALAGVVATPSVAGAASSLVLVQAWIPGSGLAHAVNGVAWTLSCEAFFYLVFPFIVPWIRRMTRRQALASASACLAFGVLINVGFLEPRGITVSTFPPFRLWEFVFGMALAVVLRRDERQRTFSASTSTVALGLVLCATTLMPTIRGLAPVAVALWSGALLVRLATIDRTGTPTRMNTSWWQFAGRISYPFYLVQGLPVAIMVAIAGRWRPTGLLERSLWIGCWLIAVMVLAVVLHRAVEVPGRRLVTGRARRAPGVVSSSRSGPTGQPP